MNHWLVKSEPETYSIDHLKKDKVADWHGVRNYQARNYLIKMEPGDMILFYHSNATPPGIAGLSRVKKKAHPDLSQFDKKSEFFEKRATQEKPIWFCPDLEFVEKFDEVLSLDTLREEKKLEGLELLRKGSRLSVIPVSAPHFKKILKMAGSKFDAE